MDPVTILRRVSLARLLVESIILIGMMMLLTAHAAYMRSFVVMVQPSSSSSSAAATSEEIEVTADHTAEEHPATGFLLQEIEIAVAWLFFYFMVPRTICGLIAVVQQNAMLLTVHIVLTVIITVMYVFLGFVCMIVESAMIAVVNYVFILIEASTVFISWKLRLDACSKASESGNSGGNIVNGFNWRRFVGEDVPATTTTNPA